MHSKPQVCVVHGGTTFLSQQDYLLDLRHKTINYERLLYAPSWKHWLGEQLPSHDVLLPSMPNPQNAQYAEWSTLFSKIIPLLQPSAVLVGHSLGGIFLAKYLCDNVPDRPFRKIILVAAPYNDESQESLGGFLLESASPLVRAAQSVTIFHSVDDPVVPYTESDRYVNDLPNASRITLNGKLHCNEPTFPELLTAIQDSER